MTCVGKCANVSMGTSMRWWKPGWNWPLGCNLCTVWVYVLDGLDRIGHLQHYTASSPLPLTFADFSCTVHVCRRTTAKKTKPRISIWRPQQMAPSWFNILMSLFNFSPAERALKTKYVWKLPAGSLVISSVNIHIQLDFGKLTSSLRDVSCPWRCVTSPTNILP